MQTIIGLSPSFTRQEVIDSSNDWNFWKGSSNDSIIQLHNGDNITVKNADKMSQCEKLGNEFVFPDIDSASYVSDGKKLNATVWYTMPFDDSSTNDTVDAYQENLRIKSQDLGSSVKFDLGDLANVTIARINNPLIVGDFTILGENVTNVDNNKAYKLVYSALNPNGFLLKNMTLLTIKNNKLYDITFSALNKTYESFLPNIKRSIDSISFIDPPYGSETNIEDKQKNTINGSINYISNSDEDSNLGQTRNLKNGILEFKDIGIRIIPPYGWSKNEETVDKDKNKMLVFKSRFSDERSRDPSYHEMTLTMAIAIDSLQHSGVTDYRIIYSKEKDDNSNGNYSGRWHWVTKFMEVSANDKERILEKTNSLDFLDKKYQNPPGYALFSFDLGKINYPQQYRVLFYVTDYFVLSHLYCRLVDTTNWVMIPPPEFGIYPNPNSLTLRPGESSNVEVTIKGNVDLPTQAYYESKYISNKSNSGSEQDKKSNEPKIIFIQNKISIPPSGTGTSTLNVRIPDSLDVGNKESLTIPISANISFPTTITNRGGESFSNSKSQSIVAMSNLTLTVLPPYSPEERLDNFVNVWITPINGMWTFLAGVAAVLTPVVIKFYNKKKKKETNKQSS